MTSQALSKLLEELEQIDDVDERAELLIELAERFSEVPKEIATRPFDPAHKVLACESEAYVWAKLQADGRVKLFFAIENPQGLSAKALAVILDETLSGLVPSEFKDVPETLAHTIFGEGLSMGKGIGLASMVRTVKQVALALNSER